MAAAWPRAQATAPQSSVGCWPTGSDPSTAYTFDNATWEHFTQQVWEKEPAVYKNALKAPLIDTAELLQTLQTAVGARSHTSFNVWVEREKIADLRGFLPSSADSSLENYLRRIDQRVGGREFTVLLANPHLHDAALWFRTRQFLSGLYARVGIPCGGVDTGIFLGRYGKTPFGVHRGQMSVITFPILGTKRFLLWPRGYGEANGDIQDSVQYDRHLGTAVEKVAHSGDVAYWPADYWHIADGPVSYSAALNIGLWWDRPPLQRVLFEISETLASQLFDYDPRGECISLSPTGATVPTELTGALDLVRRLIAEKEPLRLLQLAWMAFQSGGGFRDLLPARAVAAARQTARGRMVCNIPQSILAAETDDGGLVVAANGLTRTVASTPATRRLVTELQAGRHIDIPTAGGDGESQQNLVAFLLRAQAVRIAEASDAAGNRT